MPCLPPPVEVEGVVPKRNRTAHKSNLESNFPSPMQAQSQEMKDIFGEDWYRMYESGTEDIQEINRESTRHAKNVIDDLKTDTTRIMQEINMGAADLFRRV